MMARVSVPFTGGHYSGRGERPNTGLADNSLSVCRKKILCRTINMVETSRRGIF